MVETTFIIIKPDAVKRNITGKVVDRFEEAGFTIKNCKLHHLTTFDCEKLYAEHVGKDFYQRLTDFMTSGPTLLLLLDRDDAVQTARELVGSTNPTEASPGTIRGDFGGEMPRNIVHASDSLESVERESKIFF